MRKGGEGWMEGERDRTRFEAPWLLTITEKLPEAWTFFFKKRNYENDFFLFW